MNLDKFKHLNAAIRPKIDIEGQEYLYFGGTAYLGIPQNQDFLSLYMEGLSRYGINNGTSRNNNVQLGIYDEAEQIAADRFGAEAALISSSGYLAAQLVLQNCIGKGQFAYAPSTHPALWIDERSRPAGSFKEWSEDIVKQINESDTPDWVLISNSMNNLFPEIYDFDFTQKINPDKKVLVIVDDSHGIGILNGGLGAYTALPEKDNIEWIVVASMAKALGVDAGVILSSKQTIAALKNSNEYLGASPPPAAAIYAFMKAETIYRSAYQQLMKNDQLLRELLGNTSKYASVPDFPVFLSEDPQLAEKLLSRKILISSFPYPDKNSLPINRIVLCSWHSPEDIKQLSEYL